MTRSTLTALLVCIASWSVAQSREISVGIFSGITAPYTWDEGIYDDSRYQSRYEVKIAPIGIYYGIDYEGYGFVLSPSLITVGQNFNVINAVGGHEGQRKIRMNYLNIPFSLKLHVIDLSFFKVSLVGGVSLGYLVNGKETISHNHAKYRFPASVYPILPETYVVGYDGVLAPSVSHFTMLEKKDFNSIQVFGSFGFRSDWDVGENWRVSLDVRANYGFLETRSDEYLARLEGHQTLYDIAGKRREIFAYLNLGIARFIEVDKAKSNKTKSFRKFTPKKPLPVYSPKRRKGRK